MPRRRKTGGAELRPGYAGVSSRACCVGARRHLLAVAGSATLALLAVGFAGVAASPRDEDLFVRPEDQHTVLFGSMDAGRSYFVSTGAKQTPTGPLDRTGFVLLETVGVGMTRETVRTEAGRVAVERLKHQATLSAGYQWALGPVYAAAFVGPEIYQEQVAYDGRFRRFSQPRPGLQAQVEIWANPTPDTMLAATFVGETARTSVWARLAAGVRLADAAYVGPEVTVYATPTYRETRLGAHVTGLSFGIVQMRVSAGWMTDDAHRQGSPYAGLSAWIRL